MARAAPTAQLRSYTASPYPDTGLVPSRRVQRILRMAQRQPFFLPPVILAVRKGGPLSFSSLPFPPRNSSKRLARTVQIPLPIPSHLPPPTAS